MARISLRAYNRDIEAMIDRNQIDEAFSHSRYILEFYPKHVDTYRLMGKALLEAQRFSDASDVFHRVLSSVPDDFIAHLGMSIIREDESNLNGAIWHMERSFEVQPSNAAVQVELRRLYGLRDGLSPQKIQLTRGALARMSAKSNLFSQAIAELRSVLSEDPQRPDLQVVLADMYAQSGSRMEAIETCNSLISKLPYCLEANRLLAEILPETERAERAQEFKDRLTELDPYYAHLSPVVRSVAQVSEGAVTIERYEHPGESLSSQTPEQPEWATSLGITIDDETSEQEESLDWLLPDPEDTALQPEGDSLEDILQAGGEDDESESILAAEEVEQPDVDEQPEWLVPDQGESSIQSDDVPIVDLLQPEGELEEGDEAETISTEPSEVEQVPDWVSEAGEPSEVETPEWLRDAMEGVTEEPLLGAELAAAAGIAAALSDDDQDLTASTPDELESEGEELPSSEEADQEMPIEIEPDDESKDETAEPGIPPAEMISPEAAITPGIAAGAAIAGAALGASLEEGEDQDIEPDSEPLADEPALETELTAERDQISEATPDEETPIPMEDEPEIPDWLQDLGEGIPEEPVLESESEPATQEPTPKAEELDSPVSDFDIEEITEEDVPQESEPEPAVEEAPSEVEIDTSPIPIMEVGDEVLEEQFPESLPDWLSAVSPDEIPDAVEQEISGSDEQTDIVQAEIPEWLRRMEQEHLAEMLAAAGAGEIQDALDYDADFTDLSGEDVPPWLVSAMETEIISEYEAEEDIQEISPEIVEEDLVPELDVEEAVIPESLEEVSVDAEQISEIEAEKPLEEVLLPELDIDEMVATGPPEDVLIEEELVSEEVDAEEPGEGAISPELITEDAEEELINGDTQPVFVGEKIESLQVEDEIQPAQEISPIISEVEEIDAEELTPALEEEGPVGAEGDEVSVEAPLTGEDEDAAMAWLEGLAEKQGAAEEELLTTPEKRVEEPPEWVLESVSESEEEPAEEPDRKIEEIAAAAAVGAAVGALIGEEEDQEDEITVEEEAAIVSETSEWIPEATQDAEEIIEPAAEEIPLVLEVEPEITIEAEEILEPSTEEISPVEEVEPEVVPEVEGAVEPEEIEQEISAELVPTLDEDIAEIEAEEQPAEEIPEWLSGLAEDEEPIVETQPTEWSPDMLMEEDSGVEVPEEAELVSKFDLNAASLAQLERIPGIGFIHAQRIVNYRTTSGPFKNLDEIQKVPGLTPDMVDDLKDYLTVEVVVEAAPPISTIPELQEAWTSITSGEIDTAVDQYSKLIKSDQHLDEVIRDLQEALVKYPADASLYQSLGDAYLHANMLQEALDAYNRAEDLIK